MTSGGSIKRHHIVTGVKERHNILTGISEQIHNPHHMMTEPSKEAHHMVTGQTAQTNQFPEFLTGRIQTPRNPSSHQYQKL